MVETYREIYSHLKESLDIVRELVLGDDKPSREGLESLLIVRLIRERLVRLFSPEEVVKMCRRCGGSCCYNVITRLFWKELFYYIGVDPNFGFPEPDWEFLAKRLFFCCIFLSENGCLLRENRHNRCLFYVCKKLEPVVPDRMIGDFTERSLLRVTLDRNLALWCHRFVGDNKGLDLLHSDSFDEEAILKFKEAAEDWKRKREG